MNNDVFIALGTNMGDRKENLNRAVAELGKLPESKLVAISAYYDTEPVGPVQQNNFLNAVLRMSTVIPAEELLEALLVIETTVFSRIRGEVWGPRPMDLDLLYYGNELHEGPELILPHPRMHERRFVLQPLADIAPEFIHPRLGKSTRQLLAELSTTERETQTPAKELP